MRAGAALRLAAAALCLSGGLAQSYGGVAVSAQSTGAVVTTLAGARTVAPILAGNQGVYGLLDGVLAYGNNGSSSSTAAMVKSCVQRGARGSIGSCCCARRWRRGLRRGWRHPAPPASHLRVFRRRPQGLAVDDARGVLYVFADAVIRRVDLESGFTSVLAGGNGTNIFDPVIFPYPLNYPTGLANGIGTQATFGTGSGGLALAASAGVLFLADSFGASETTPGSWTPHSGSRRGRATSPHPLFVPPQPLPGRSEPFAWTLSSSPL